MNWTSLLKAGELSHNIKIFIEHVKCYNLGLQITKTKIPSWHPSQPDYVNYRFNNK